MMRIQMAGLLLVSGGVVGYLAGSYLSPGKPLRFVYQTKTDVAVFNRDDTVLGILPKGTLLLSSAEVEPEEDLGWWGYAPVYLGDMAEAHQMVVKTSQPPGQVSIMKMIWGVPPDQAHRPIRKSTDRTKSPELPRE
jgi:hypothetical protein